MISYEIVGLILDRLYCICCIVICWLQATTIGSIVARIYIIGVADNYPNQKVTDEYFDHGKEDGATRRQLESFKVFLVFRRWFWNGRIIDAYRDFVDRHLAAYANLRVFHIGELLTKCIGILVNIRISFVRWILIDFIKYILPLLGLSLRS